mmetsp:Transcript_15715/g.36191  ORF Transcript_15715/g.36191 Transcript_15715/m.36191 type:complete len:89 (-) Transcript_15715:517-783(-)
MVQPFNSTFLNNFWSTKFEPSAVQGIIRVLVVIMGVTGHLNSVAARAAPDCEAVSATIVTAAIGFDVKFFAHIIASDDGNNQHVPGEN